MLMLRNSCGVVILTVWVLSSGVRAYAGPPPAWHFKAGETLRYQLTVKNEAEVKSSGVVDAVPKKSGLSLSLTLLWTVNRVAEDGTAELTQKIEHARLTMHHAYAGRDEALYDSGDPATVNNQWSAVMDMAIRPVLHEPYFLRIDRQGRPIEVKRPESAVKAWKELGPALEDKENPFAPLFTDNGFVALLAPVLPRPSNPSDVRDSWSYSWGDPRFPMQLTDTY